jgi:3-deoxy-D-manno-octulosonic-acid transferase
MRTTLPVVLRLYLWLAHRVLPFFWRRALQRRLHRGKESLESIAQKTMQQPLSRRLGTKLVWGHAVGLGESQALIGLFHSLALRLPEHEFLITFSTQSASEAVQRMGLPPRCQWRFAPIDTPNIVKTFLDQSQPCLLICCESDLWPVMLIQTAAQEIPMALVNVRLRAVGWKARPPLRAAYQYLFGQFTRIYTQNKQSIDILQSLGVAREKLQISGTIKALAPALPCDNRALEALQHQLQDRWIWVLGSSHQGEEVFAIQAHAYLQANDGRQPLLIIAPRYLNRSSDVAKVCPPDTPRRSRGEIPTAAPVFIADSFGEMGLWYRLAEVALVGGSLVPVGGHNPFEPAKLGCYCLYGPHVWNFEEAYAQLANIGMAEEIHSVETLHTAIQRQLDRPTPRHDRPIVDLTPLEKMIEELTHLG